MLSSVILSVGEESFEEILHFVQDDKETFGLTRVQRSLLISLLPNLSDLESGLKQSRLSG